MVGDLFVADRAVGVDDVRAGDAGETVTRLLGAAVLLGDLPLGVREQLEVEMRDRFDLDFQLLADPEGEVAEQYSGTQETSHGFTGVAGTYVIDTDGAIRYEQAADHPADRTYGNFVRYFIRNDFADPFGGD